MTKRQPTSSETDRAFWDLVELVVTATDGGAKLISRRLRAELESCTPAEIARHFEEFTKAVWALYSFEVRGAASFLVGELSDDGFASFRSWLVFQGRSLFDTMALDSDTGFAEFLEATGLHEMDLASVWEFTDGECIESAFLQAYEVRTGHGPDLGSDFKQEIAGLRWESRDELPARFPRLSALCERGEYGF